MERTRIAVQLHRVCFIRRARPGTGTEARVECSTNVGASFVVNASMRFDARTRAQRDRSDGCFWIPAAPAPHVPRPLRTNAWVGDIERYRAQFGVLVCNIPPRRNRGDCLDERTMHIIAKKTRSLSRRNAQ